ncbi:Fatty acid desaturase [Pseudobythopirellula maris]|uniref:Fatty acid desaturase n=1 Tax=Pseudobythopirellula maris TaxID=2527991 RepID=A0A5C5ZKG3_9BACT|nr:acyl-CoA desaturase [Pseudobythopirellula maris]TWT87625.1 Fatty acid desaturase [Pseudobythopirellula maris]
MSIDATPQSDPLTTDAGPATLTTPAPTRPPRGGAKPAPKSRRRTAMDTPMPPANSWAMWRRGLDWPTVIWIGMVHVFAIAAPFYFSWQGLAVCAILSVMTGSLGVCMGYHRLLTHKSFQTYKPIRWLLAFVGGLSGEGSALTWVANHRKHHAFSDKEGDPHSPRDGKWWSHMTWFMPNLGQKWHKELLNRYAADLMKDRMMVLLHKMFLPSHIVLGLALYAVGYWGQWMGLDGGWRSGLSMLLWGTGVRMVYVLHVTWMVNSATHLWGYRNYETSDDSKNLWWVGLLAFGEGWHNNHHAFQRVASQGHRWWEIDFTYWVILAMEKTGLAWNVVRLRDIPKGARPA